MKMTFKEIHEKTNIVVADAKQIDQIPQSWIKIYFKSYPRFKKIQLPEPNRNSLSLYDLIMKRKSRREFNNKPISIEELCT